MALLAIVTAVANDARFIETVFAAANTVALSLPTPVRKCRCTQPRGRSLVRLEKPPKRGKMYPCDKMLQTWNPPPMAGMRRAGLLRPRLTSPPGGAPQRGGGAPPGSFATFASRYRRH